MARNVSKSCLIGIMLSASVAISVGHSEAAGKGKSKHSEPVTAKENHGGEAGELPYGLERRIGKKGALPSGLQKKKNQGGSLPRGLEHGGKHQVSGTGSGK